MLSTDKFGHVVYLSLDSNIEVVCACVVCACVFRDLSTIPSLVVTWAEQASEDNTTIPLKERAAGNGYLLLPC